MIRAPMSPGPMTRTRATQWTLTRALSCVGVKDHFLVRQARGPRWDTSRSRREQAGWSDHAAFIEQLSESGRIPLGGPVGDVDGQHALLLVRAESEDEVREMLADDPWTDTVLRIESVERWTLWIGADRLPAP